MTEADRVALARSMLPSQDWPTFYEMALRAYVIGVQLLGDSASITLRLSKHTTLPLYALIAQDSVNGAICVPPIPLFTSKEDAAPVVARCIEVVNDIAAQIRRVSPETPVSVERPANEGN